MKSQPSTPEPSKSGPSPSGQTAAAPDRSPQYKLEVAYYSTMKPQRVYPLVVEVPRGKSAVPADAPTGMMLTVRAVVPGALVAPAEAPLEVSRPGARATFHVTPLARGPLPGASVSLFHDGRRVQEVLTPMRVRTPRRARWLLVLALVVPALLWYARYRSVDCVALEQDLRGALHAGVPEFPGSDRVLNGMAFVVGTAGESLCGQGADPRAALVLGVALLVLALGSWLLNASSRARVAGSVVLPPGASSATLHGDQTAETLPITPD
jgi:hypothetical protein